MVTVELSAVAFDLASGSELGKASASGDDLCPAEWSADGFGSDTHVWLGPNQNQINTLIEDALS